MFSNPLPTQRAFQWASLAPPPLFPQTPPPSPPLINLNRYFTTLSTKHCGLHTVTRQGIPVSLSSGLVPTGLYSLLERRRRMRRRIRRCQHLHHSHSAVGIPPDTGSGAAYRTQLLNRTCQLPLHLSHCPPFRTVLMSHPPSISRDLQGLLHDVLCWSPPICCSLPSRHLF